MTVRDILVKTLWDHAWEAALFGVASESTAEEVADELLPKLLDPIFEWLKQEGAEVDPERLRKAVEENHL